MGPTRDFDRGVGKSVARPDGLLKVAGEFAYASDLHRPGALWGTTVRSPYARARILRIETDTARQMDGVEAVLTAADIPGSRWCGPEGDQAVLAGDEVAYWGEPVALVVARDRESAKAAAKAVTVVWEVLPPLVDPVQAVAAGSLYRDIAWERGPDLRGSVAVEGYYEVGMQDQAPLGLEAGLAIPDGRGGVDIYAASQWLHEDRDQIAASLAVAPDDVRVHPTGVGGAFGAREDLNLQVHLGMMALRTGQAVRMEYGRGESFAGHVHRHPARLWYRHEADASGRLVRVECTLLVDGGAYGSTSGFVIGTAAVWAVGPYRCPSVRVRGFAARTNNPPAGAMRGFGAVQACIGYEAQMDRLAAALGLDPVAIRRLNALATGDPLPVSGQEFTGALPVIACLDAVAALPLPEGAGGQGSCGGPEGVLRGTPASAVRRGVGYAIGIKNAGFPEGFDDYSDARVILHETWLEVQTAAVEVGQGLVSVLAQIARTASGIDDVRVAFVGTSEIGSAGSTSASRQTQLNGGAVYAAVGVLRDRILAFYACDHLDDRGAWRGDDLVAPLPVIASQVDPVAEARFRHPPTTAPNDRGGGSPTADVMIAAHRAVVDVDIELGLVRVVEVATAQDVGFAINPQAVIGQIEGGIAQGIGLAFLEELVVEEGRIRNATFTDYLLPTFVDVPNVTAVLLEEACSWSPFGAKGVGEPPTVSSTAAVVAAIRAATGRELMRVPVRAADIALDPGRLAFQPPAPVVGSPT